MVAHDHVRALIDDELCQFCATAVAHEGRLLGFVLLAADVEEPTGRVVHRSRQHAGEGQFHVMFG